MPMCFCIDAYSSQPERMAFMTIFRMASAFILECLPLGLWSGSFNSMYVRVLPFGRLGVSPNNMDAKFILLSSTPAGARGTWQSF